MSNGILGLILLGKCWLLPLFAMTLKTGNTHAPAFEINTVTAYAIGQRAIKTTLVPGAIFADFVVCRWVMFGFALGWEFTRRYDDNTEHKNEGDFSQHVSVSFNDTFGSDNLLTVLIEKTGLMP